MLDQRTAIIRLLKVMGLADEWHVVEPIPGDIKGIVIIQNKLGLKAEVPLPSANIHDITDDASKIARIRTAIAKATQPS